MSQVRFSAAIDSWGPLVFSRILHPLFHQSGMKCCVDLNVPGDCTHLCLTLALSSLGDTFFLVPLCLTKSHSLFKFQFRHHLLWAAMADLISLHWPLIIKTASAEDLFYKLSSKIIFSHKVFYFILEIDRGKLRSSSLLSNLIMHTFLFAYDASVNIVLLTSHYSLYVLYFINAF